MNDLLLVRVVALVSLLAGVAFVQGGCSTVKRAAINKVGYAGFFGWVCVATIPSFVVTALIKVDDRYGRAPTR